MSTRDGLTVKPKLLIIEPRLTTYRMKAFYELSGHYDICIVTKGVSEAEKLEYGDVEKYLNNIYLYYSKLINFSVFYKYKDIKNIINIFKPDKILISSDIKNLTMWSLLLRYKLGNIKIYLYGHGAFKSGRFKFIKKLIYSVAALLCQKYLCYTRQVYESFYLKTRYKLSIINNTLINEFPVLPINKKGSEFGILFIGRLRDNTNILELINILSKINYNNYRSISLHVIGDGQLMEKLKIVSGKYNWLNLHGPIFDDYKITEISLNCRIGIYPGDAGLSIVHYMSLSLPVIIHNNLGRHMGPEAEYVLEGYNGYKFPREDWVSLAKLIKKIFYSNMEIKEITKNAFYTYTKLSETTLARKILNETL